MADAEEDKQGFIELAFENSLWVGRWAVLLAVIGGMLTSAFMFYIASIDVYYLILLVGDYFTISDVPIREALRADAVGHAVEVIDGFLLAIVLLIFSYGIYELYISKIDRAYKDDAANHLLRINNLDDLKTRLGKVILMILVVKFFEMAVSIDVSDMDGLLMLAVAIILIGITLFMNQLVEYVIHKNHSGRRGADAPDHPDRGGKDRRLPRRETADNTAPQAEVKS
ncbi:MAG: YqhA family protein [Mariprofundaceae bacterium]